MPTASLMLRRPVVSLLVAAWWLASPIVEAVFYSTEQSRGAYPPQADSIVIPIFKFAIVWVLLTPFVAGLIWLALRLAPARFPWLAFDPGRRLWCVFWTLALGTFAFSELWFCVASIGRNHPEDVAGSLLGIFAALALRAAICARRDPLALIAHRHAV